MYDDPQKSIVHCPVTNPAERNQIVWRVRPAVACVHDMVWMQALCIIATSTMVIVSLVNSLPGRRG